MWGEQMGAICETHYDETHYDAFTLHPFNLTIYAAYNKPSQKTG